MADVVVADVVVAGAGPAGWAVADQCARHGLRTVLVGPRPLTRWHATYGMWADECALLPAASHWVESATTRAVASSERDLPNYAVLDNDTVRAAMAHPDVAVCPDRVTSASFGTRGCSVTLASGRVLAAAVVIDATGSRRVLSGGPVQAPRTEQTAYGLILPAEAAQPLVAPGDALFMDWQPAPGFDGVWPTFLYAVPVPGHRTLLEETSLARRPGLGMAELRSRLTARLAARGIRPAGWATERVRIPLDLPTPRVGGLGVVAFGAAAAVVHPATGYSLADTLRLAPRVAEAIARALPAGPAAASRAARHVVWPPTARAVHRLRRRGLAALLALRPEQVPAFFEIFFALPADRQRAYLSGREDLAGTAAAMAAIFRAADRSTRATIARHALLPTMLR